MRSDAPALLPILRSRHLAEMLTVLLAAAKLLPNLGFF
jgi:hypothetical protein